MNGRLMNVSDGCPTSTCLSMKLRRCYFYVISTVSMLLVIIIINYDYCQIALYKMNCIVLPFLYMYIVYYSPLNLLDIGLETIIIIICGNMNTNHVPLLWPTSQVLYRLI